MVHTPMTALYSRQANYASNKKSFLKFIRPFFENNCHRYHDPITKGNKA